MDPRLYTQEAQLRLEYTREKIVLPLGLERAHQTRTALECGSCEQDTRFWRELWPGAPKNSEITRVQVMPAAASHTG